jgi:hypothetical protein
MFASAPAPASIARGAEQRVGRHRLAGVREPLRDPHGVGGRALGASCDELCQPSAMRTRPGHRHLRGDQLTVEGVSDAHGRLAAGGGLHDRKPVRLELA